MRTSDEISRTNSSLWTTASGEVAHPDSPRGGGGPGRFASSMPLGTVHSPADLPHPHSPVGRNMLATDAENVAGAAKSKPAVTRSVTLNITINPPRVSTFTIGGKTLAEAKQALDRREEWGLYDATRNFKSSAQVDGNGHVGSVTIELNPVIELPVWSGYGSATKEQKASWDAMYHALKAHENRHHRIQVECVEGLKNDLKAAKALTGEMLNELIEKAQRSAQEQQDAYDTSSAHGANEGVVLKLDA